MKMEEYDYKKALAEDIRDYIEEAEIIVTPDNLDEVEDRLRDELWPVDSVTGNGSGSYTFNAWKAEENLCHNLNLLGEALAEYGCEASYITDEGAEACDVTIRCYLMPQVLGQVLRELADEYEEDGEEENSEALDRIARGEE